MDSRRATTDHRGRKAQRAEIRHIIAMSIPMVITASSRAVMDIADYVMLTRLGVPDILAAILPAQIVMWSYIVLGLGIASVVNTFAAQAWGRGRPRECGAYAWQAMYVAGFFGLVGVAALPFLPQLVSLMGHEAGVQHHELAYTRIALLTLFPTIAANALGWFFVGVHRPWITMWSALEANVVNVVASFCLIFGLLGFEPMGMAGAAWGTLIAVSFRTLRLLVTMFLPTFDRQFGTRTAWRPSYRRTVNLVRVGLPCGLQWLCEVVVWAIFVSVLVGKTFGTVHLVATNTAWQYMRIAFVPTIGLGQALTAIVGKSIGQRDPDRAIRVTRFIMTITFVYMGTLSIIYALKAPELLLLFNATPEVVAIGTKIMWCAAIFQLFDAFGITYSSALRGAGDTFVPSVFFIVSHWVIIVGGGWFIAETMPELGSLGPWMAASLLIAVTGVFLWWRWHTRAWMRIDLLRSPPDSPANSAPVTAVAQCGVAANPEA